MRSDLSPPILARAWGRLALATTLAAVLCAAGSALAHGSHVTPEAAKRWQERVAAAPRLAVAAQYDESGRLWLARVVGQQIFVSHSTEGSKAFSEPLAVNREPELITADGESRPQIAVVGQRVYVAWTQVLPQQPYAGHVRFAFSEDGGRSFGEAVTINDDAQPVSHRFHALFANAREVVLAWVDERNRDPGYRGAAIYTARSTDGGRSFAANQKLADHSCECCRLGMAADSDGSPVVFWRHIFDKKARDFALARLGEPLRRASEDGWEIDACPHHGGALAIDGEGRRHLAWFTGAEDSPGLHYRYIDGDAMSLPKPFGNIDAQAGHPQVAMLGQQVVLVWREYDGRNHSIRQMVSRDRGQRWSAPTTIARTTGAADDPLLRDDGKAVWLVWNTAADGLKRMRIAP